MGKISVLRLEVDDERQPFDCGDPDLNEFFEIDSRKSSLELLSVTFVVQKEGHLVAFFSVSNDSLKREEVGREPLKRATHRMPKQKRYKSLPAVKVGRFAVAKEEQSCGLGRRILDFIKAWFTVGNKTGCRFIIVDAYKKSTGFYLRNGFSFLSEKDKDDETRLMYFDLILAINKDDVPA